MDSLLSRMIYGDKAAAKDTAANRESTERLPQSRQQRTKSRPTSGSAVDHETSGQKRKRNGNNSENSDSNKPKQKRGSHTSQSQEGVLTSDNDNGDDGSSHASSSPSTSIQGWQKEVDAIHQKAATLLHAVYGVPSTADTNNPFLKKTTQTAAAAFSNPFLVNANRPPVRIPRKTRKVTNPYKCRKPWAVEEPEYRDLTPEELELGNLKYQRGLEWATIRNRWKKRRLDFRDEVDVGQAVANRARMVMAMKRKLHLEQKEQEKSTTHAEQKEDVEVEEQPEDPDPDLESSDEEHDQIYRRLMEASQDDKKEEGEDSEELKKKQVQQELETFRKSYAETLEYWELGRVAPRQQELPFSYQRDVPDQVLSSRIRGQNRNRTTRKVSATRERDQHRKQRLSTGVVLPNQYNSHHAGSHQPDPNAYFHFPLNHRVYAPKQFLHRRQLMRLAARFIVGTGGTDENRAISSNCLENRLLRIMWQKDHDKSCRLFRLLTLTQEFGLNLETFLSRSWKDGRSRYLAARHLGVYPAEQDLTPPYLVGCSMATLQVQAYSRKERLLLIRNHAKTSQNSCVSGLEQLEDTDELTGKRLIPPNSTYIYAQGTAPPAPSFPLNETGLVFGPSDKHSMFRHAGPIDEETYTLTISSLLSRLAAADNFNEDDSSIDEDNNVESACLLNQLSVLVERAPIVALNAHNYIVKRMAKRKMPVTEIALVQFYRTIIGFFAFSACGVAQNPSIENGAHNDGSDFDQGLESTLHLHRDDVEQLTWDSVARKIYDFSRPFIGQNGLEAFPKFRLVYGISLIARILPPEAAETMSRPLDDQKFRTPFDNLKHMLGYMEQQDLLVDDIGGPGLSESDNALSVGELEYYIHQATDVFLQCLERDPAEANFHAWYLGSLGASLLLCSGNRIGSGARAYPSSYTGIRASRDDFFGDDILVDHGGRTEKRKMLPKFDEARERVRRAFGLFVHATQTQPANCRMYQAISAFLEWSQVVALMVGQSCENPIRMRDIQKCHVESMVRWAHLERSTLAMKYFKALAGSGSASCDEKLNQLATIVELDPCNLESWRELVKCLGPIGYLSCDETDQQCDETPCKECCILRGGLFVDHASLKSRKMLRQWWGTDRVSWWYPHFLDLFLPGVQETKAMAPDAFNKMIAEIGRNLPRDPPAYIFRQRDHNISMDAPVAALSWLLSDHEAEPHPVPRTPGGEEKEDKGTRSQPKRSKLFDDELPIPFYDVLSACRNRSDGEDVQETSVDEYEEMVFCKLLVSCHLFGLAFPSLKQMILNLVRRCFDEDLQLKDCPEWRSLVRLYDAGVDIVKVLTTGKNCHILQTRKPCCVPSESLIPEAEKEAIRDGVQRFGAGEWTKIMNNYYVFQGRYRRVRYVYYYMVKNGEIEDTRPPRTRKIYGTPELRSAVKRGVERFGARNWTKVQRSDPLLQSLRYNQVLDIGHCLIRSGEV